MAEASAALVTAWMASLECVASLLAIVALAAERALLVLARARSRKRQIAAVDTAGTVQAAMSASLVPANRASMIFCLCGWLSTELMFLAITKVYRKAEKQ